MNLAQRMWMRGFVSELWKISRKWNARSVGSRGKEPRAVATNCDLVQAIQPSSATSSSCSFSSSIGVRGALLIPEDAGVGCTVPTARDLTCAPHSAILPNCPPTTTTFCPSASFPSIEP
jgi:hypothetical protein